MFTKAMSLTLLALVWAMPGSPTTIVRDFARDTATLSQFLLSRNCRPRVPKSPAQEHIEMMTTGASCP